jgi:hypothetical protein
MGDKTEKAKKEKKGKRNATWRETSSKDNTRNAVVKLTWE